MQRQRIPDFVADTIRTFLQTNHHGDNAKLRIFLTSQRQRIQPDFTSDTIRFFIHNNQNRDSANSGIFKLHIKYTPQTTKSYVLRRFDTSPTISGKNENDKNTIFLMKNNKKCQKAVCKYKLAFFTLNSHQNTLGLSIFSYMQCSLETVHSPHTMQ